MTYVLTTSSSSTLRMDGHGKLSIKVSSLHSLPLSQNFVKLWCDQNRWQKSDHMQAWARYDLSFVRWGESAPCPRNWNHQEQVLLSSDSIVPKNATDLFVKEWLLFTLKRKVGHCTWGQCHNEAETYLSRLTLCTLALTNRNTLGKHNAFLCTEW